MRRVAPANIHDVTHPGCPQLRSGSRAATDVSGAAVEEQVCRAAARGFPDLSSSVGVLYCSERSKIVGFPAGVSRSTEL